MKKDLPDLDKGNKFYSKEAIELYRKRMKELGEEEKTRPKKGITEEEKEKLNGN